MRVDAVVQGEMLWGNPPIVSQQEGAAPEEGRKHEEDTDIVCEVSQPMIPFQQAQHCQNIIPVVPVSFLSGHAADQHKVQRPRIIDVGRDIHHALCRPPRGHRSPERIASLHEERDKTDHRHENLTERSAQNRQEPTERRENHVSGFMEGKIDQVKKRLARVIRFEGRGDKFPSPPDHGHKHRSPTVERHPISGRV